MDHFGERPKKFYGPPDVRGGPPDDSNGDDEYLYSDKPNLDEMPGVYSDIRTKRTIYNELETPEPAPGERRRTTVDRDAKFTQFSEEWFDQRQILDKEGERGLLPADQLFVPDELEGRSPFEVLGVPEGDVVEAHKSYRMLMRTLHPDVVGMAINNAIDKAMGGSNAAWKQFIELSKVFSEWQERKPKVLKDEELSALSEGERQKYIDAYKEWQNEKPGEGSIETVRQEIKASAEKKTRVLNAAWDQIKKGLSFENIVGAAAHWETSHGTSISDRYGDAFILHPYQTIHLEADAEIYRNLDFTVTDAGELLLKKAEPAYLGFASGFDKRIGIYEQYRESYSLKHLFAFLEHRDGRTIHHALLSDVAEEFELTGFQIGTLQNLMKANVDAEKICEELGVRPQFDLPHQSGRDAIPVDNIIENIVDGGTFGSARIDRFAKAGYTPETLTALTSFVMSEKPRAEQDIRNESNRVTYSVARSTSESFAKVREREEKKSSTVSREYSPQKYVASKIRTRLFELQQRPHQFAKTIQDIQRGPTYTTHEEDTVEYRVGVEFGRDGLRLVLPVQESLNQYNFSSVTEVFFNQNDLGIMKEIAYGRSVTGTPSKGITGKR
ncbi:J domain-containing protein [Candidatus Kaiserbacteria bacterium]|nr:J domain-containing protein [Candidatus Kaiserbacteria bacterium]